ncbi:MAG: hypothetical protein NWF00_11780 [Candidatus Bathyarchaeota archaeon]|nr:hypothetical protein [Candidatus Bathyarchaeota archaeon]
MRTEKEIREQLQNLENKRVTKGPFREWENIAIKATKQTSEWVLENAKSPLTY